MPLNAVFDPMTGVRPWIGRRKAGTQAEGGIDARHDSFQQDVLTHLDSLYGTALRLTRRVPDAEDLVQETYLKALRFSGSFERGTNLRAWLFTILHNTFRNMRRHVSRNPIDVDSEAVERAAERGERVFSPEDLLLRSTIDVDLQAALDALPDPYREAVWLRDVEELTYQEIATALDIPIGTVMSRISRGRRLLHDHLTAANAGGAAAGSTREAEIAGGH